MGPRHFLGEELVQGLQHDVATLVVNAANEFHVFVEEVICRNLVGHHLVEGAGVQVGALLQLYEFADDLTGRNNPAQAQSGSECLRERAEINDVSEGISIVAAKVNAVENGQGGEMVSLVTKLSVGIVFDEWDSVLVSQKDQFFATFQ